VTLKIRRFVDTLQSSDLFSRTEWRCRISSCLFTIGILLYFIAPFKVSFIGSSLHVLPVLLAFTLSIGTFDCKLIALRELFLLAFALLLLISICRVLAVANRYEEIGAWVVSLIMYITASRITLLVKRRHISFANEIILSIWSISCIAQAKYGSIAYVAGWFGNPQVSIYSQGLTIYSNQAAVFIVTLSMVVLWENVQKPNVRRYIVWALAASGLYFTMSRSGYLALILGIGVTMLLVRRNIIWIARILRHGAIVIVLFIVCNLAVTSLDDYEPFGAKSNSRWTLSTESQLLAKDYSAVTRYTTYCTSLEMIKRKPWFGYGISNYKNTYNYFKSECVEKTVRKLGLEIDNRKNMTPHNGFLQLAAEAGLPALIMFIAFMSLTLRYSISEEVEYYVPFVSTIISICFWLLFHDSINIRILWIVLGLINNQSLRGNPVRVTDNEKYN